LEENIQFAKNLGANIVRLKGSSVPAATAEFATQQRITQVIFGRSALTGLKRWLYFLAIQKFITAAPHVDLHIITQETR
jgi:two-component system sensor histidine kinase KdpD